MAGLIEGDEVALGRLVEFQSGYAFSGNNFEMHKTGNNIPVVKIADITMGCELNLENCQFHQYDEKSRLLKDDLIELIPKLQQCKIKRIDVCFDFPKVPNKIIKKLCLSGREPFPVKNTIYYKTAKEKKSNQILDIKRYNKQIKERLSKPMERLEFCFKGAYFNNLTLSQLDEKLLLKMEKTIKKFSGINAKIFPIS